MSDCANDPGPHRRQDGKCHICGEWKSCGFCSLCCHWFCRECSSRIFARAAAAFEELVGGVKEGCCGPGRQGVSSRAGW